jgi:hypothetical protein
MRSAGQIDETVDIAPTQFVTLEPFIESLPADADPFTRLSGIPGYLILLKPLKP